MVRKEFKCSRCGNWVPKILLERNRRENTNFISVECPFCGATLHGEIDPSDYMTVKHKKAKAIIAAVLCMIALYIPFLIVSYVICSILGVNGLAYFLALILDIIVGIWLFRTMYDYMKYDL